MAACAHPLNNIPFWYAGVVEIPFHNDRIFNYHVDSRLVNDQGKYPYSIKRKTKLYQAYHTGRYYRGNNRIYWYWRWFYYCSFPCFICRAHHEKSHWYQPDYYNC